MTKYILLHRKKYKIAKNHDEFVTWMRKCDYQKWEDNQEFMEGYSFRKLTFEKMNINYDSIENFVNDLQKNEILKLEEDKLGILKYLNLF